jgi:hypothetical protein
LKKNPGIGLIHDECTPWAGEKISSEHLKEAWIPEQVGNDKAKENKKNARRGRAFFACKIARNKL